MLRASESPESMSSMQCQGYRPRITSDVSDGQVRISPTAAKTASVVKGFRTGDIVRAVVSYGKKIGTYDCKVAVRRSRSFNVSTATSGVQGISYKYCSVVHRADGYSYLTKTGAHLGNELPSTRAQELS
jgi:hypothetical protein